MDKRERHIQAVIKSNAKHQKRIPFNLNLNTDKDILDHLETVENKQGYIKALIRKDINKL